MSHTRHHPTHALVIAALLAATAVTWAVVTGCADDPSARNLVAPTDAQDTSRNAEPASTYRDGFVSALAGSPWLPYDMRLATSGR